MLDKGVKATRLIDVLTGHFYLNGEECVSVLFGESAIIYVSPLGLYLVIFVLLMCIMCYPLQLSLFVHVLSRSFLHHAFVYKSVFSF